MALLLSFASSADAVDELPRIAVLWPGDVPRWNDAFLDGLRESGFVDGVSAAIHIRATGRNFESGPALASELVSLAPQVIFVSPGILGKHVLRELERSRKDIPVVVLTSDPVGEEVVPAIARQGKNVTGLASRPGPEMLTKHLQLLRDLLPKANRVAYFLDTSWYLGNYYRISLEVLEKGGHHMGITISPIELASPDQLEGKFAEAAQKAQAAIIPGGPTFAGNRDRVTRLAVKYRLPVIYGDELFAYSGGLISYGTSVAEMERRAGSLVAKILRGGRAADMPVEYPTRFRLIVNLRAAASLGLEIPQSVLILSDEFIR